MLEPGIKGLSKTAVTEDKTAKAYGSGELRVFATPAMIALMEQTCYQSVASYLEEGQGTVGTMLSVEHTAATPVGMTVTCESELIAVDGRKLTFRVTCSDENGEIGRGTHERFIIFNDRFTEKTYAKLN